MVKYCFWKITSSLIAYEFFLNSGQDSFIASENLIEKLKFPADTQPCQLPPPEAVA